MGESEIDPGPMEEKNHEVLDVFNSGFFGVQGMTYIYIYVKASLLDSENTTSRSVK